MKKVLCGGISTCDVYVSGLAELPKPGTAVEVDDVFFQIGGGAANSMIDYCRLGGECILCLRIGRDFAGAVIKGALQEYQSQMELSIHYDDGPTAISVVFSSKQDRSFAASLGTTLKFCAVDIPDEQIARADIVYISGGCLMHSFDCPSLTAFFENCKKLGKITVLDTAYDMRDKWFFSIAEALPYIDYFIPSYDEAVKMTNLENPDQIINFFRHHGANTTVLKLGAEGCLVDDGESRILIPSYLVETKDTTGAGDSFCAGFCYGLANDWTIRKCVAFGNAVGAFCVSAIGANAGIPQASEVLRFMELRA